MTSLRSFQTEIDDIHARELAKQRALGAAAKEKEALKKHGPQTDTKSPAKATSPVRSKVGDAKVSAGVVTPAGDAKQHSDASTTKEAPTSPTTTTDAQQAEDAVAEAQESEIQVCLSVRCMTHPYFMCPSKCILQELLLSKAPADLERARDLLAGLLTRHRGEYVFRLGSRPTNTRLYNGAAATEGDEGWLGTQRSEEELNTLKEQLNNAVEDVGGKVRYRCFCGSQSDC